MIITERKPFNEILEYLKNAEKVVLVGCGECATVCQTGGTEQLEAMKARLEVEGKQVVGSLVLSTSCNYLMDKKELKSIRSALEEADAVLSLACGDGVQTVAELVDLQVFPANNTMFVGETVRNGIFHERCKTCGRCLLGKTAAICPVTQCGKSLLNGACGGSQNGKCEVNAENDCAWIEIYKRLKELGQEDTLEVLEPIRGYKDVIHPRVINLRKKKEQENANESA